MLDIGKAIELAHESFERGYHCDPMQQIVAIINGYDAAEPKPPEGQNTRVMDLTHALLGQGLALLIRQLRQASPTDPIGHLDDVVREVLRRLMMLGESHIAEAEESENPHRWN